MTEPRKHHMVPQSLLRQFTRSGNPDQLFVYDKQRSRSFPSAVRDAGAERDFYAVETAGQRYVWEPAFQALDDRLADVVRELSTTNDAGPAITANARDICLLAATQHSRTRLQRTSPADLTEQLNRVGVALGIRRTELTDVEIRLLHLQRMAGIDDVAEILWKKDILLLDCTGGQVPLWTSDNPVVFHNSFPYGDVGLDAPGVELYFPVSSTRCLAFFCPSIGEQIRESLNPARPRAQLAAPIFANILRGIDTGSMISIDDSYVTFLNDLQLRQSSRFIYSSDDDFGNADVLLERAPSLRQVDSLVKLGEIGAAPPALAAMPAGTFLLLERGHSHHIFPVVDRSARPGVELAVEILDSVKLSTVDIESNFDLATLIVDGVKMRYMREIVLEPDNREGVHVVKHADAGLQSMLDSLNREQ